MHRPCSAQYAGNANNAQFTPTARDDNMVLQVMMMMMMMMDELTLTWHIVLRLQGHVTVKKESRTVDALVDCTSRDSCMSERKARSSVYHEKLAVMTKPERTLARRCELDNGY